MNSPFNPELIGSCDCLTKTPEVQHHKPGCKYRLISERDAAIAERDEARTSVMENNTLLDALTKKVARLEECNAAVTAERDRLKATVANQQAALLGSEEAAAQMILERDRLKEQLADAQLIQRESKFSAKEMLRVYEERDRLKEEKDRALLALESAMEGHRHAREHNQNWQAKFEQEQERSDRLAAELERVREELSEAQNPNCEGSLAFREAETALRLQEQFEKAKDWNKLTELELANLRTLNEGLEAELEQARKDYKESERKVNDLFLNMSNQLDAALGERDAAQDQVRRLRDGLGNLMTALDAAHNSNEYYAVWATAQISLGPYRGPSYTVELQEARTLLSTIPPDEGKGEL